MKNIAETRVVRAPVWRYGVAAGAALAGVSLRMLLAPLLGNNTPFILLFLATTVSATFGGRGPGLLATGLGAALSAYFILSPGGSFQLAGLHEYAALLLFVAVGCA